MELFNEATKLFSNAANVIAKNLNERTYLMNLNGKYHNLEDLDLIIAEIELCYPIFYYLNKMYYATDCDLNELLFIEKLKQHCSSTINSSLPFHFNIHAAVQTDTIVDILEEYIKTDGSSVDEKIKETIIRSIRLGRELYKKYSNNKEVRKNLFFAISYLIPKEKQMKNNMY